ncbi:MmgE/PrpD family protein [Enterovirga rhinocerotis]|uniref:2-methylcitrate dehydratase PrpD n=1 Tax=Enterovirga rhinocerotis TaxID=1339210 RepID=A0A4R7C4V7_9HYPH|nr:MmgE/PrpD family protein [Enterovirga rhinocerotis]TDR92882.1 2-methylcitrate dehydratase PrpD [Enterovirga rhinocerotis]
MHGSIAPPPALVPGPTADLAVFVESVGRGGVPDGVRSVLEDALVDSVGCGLFGLTTDACRIVQGFAEAQGGPQEASLWGAAGRRVSVANAALAVGTAIHGFDFDDHSRAKIHPGAAILPAVFAFAERDDLSGETALRALAAGYEVMNRVSLATNPNSSRMRGWHLTGTTGTFGAAAASAVALGLDAWTVASALGLAGTQSAGLWAFNADGAMSKRLHPGRAAQAGIVAAQLAARGFEGPRQILETSDGGFFVAMSDDPRPAEVARELGRVWRLEGAAFKPYSCCGSNHAAVDAAIALRREEGFCADDIDRVLVGISRVVERQTGFPYRQSTVLNAQMSIRYNVAVALADGTALIEQFTPHRLGDSSLNALIARIDVEVDAEMDAVYPALYAGIVTIRLKDGRSFRRRVDHSKGMPENRMSSGEIDAKFLSLVGAASGDETARELLPRLRAAFDSPTLAPLARSLGRAAIRT